MSFENLEIRKSYINQGKENIVDCLINPALRQAVSYKRSVGFFSSSVFTLLVNALPFFIQNKGYIQLIVSPQLSSEDISAIKLGYTKKEEIVNRRFIEDFDRELEAFDDSSLNILSELVARGILDIKVASVKNEVGIYHDKLGILTDKNNNTIVFYGSPNSSINAYQNNYERVRVVRSWVKGEGDSAIDEIKEFDSLWNNENEYVEVYNFMDSVRKCIVKIIQNRESNANRKEPITLYDYQNDAIAAWKRNNYKGFYVMATGTGKTWTAIYSAKELLKEHPALIVIAAPYKHLVKQWAEDVEKVFKEATIVLVTGENQHWYRDARQAVISQSYDARKQIVLITTITSFNSEKFKRLIHTSTQEKLLIVDEAHRFTQRPEELKEEYRFMLGLSATPINGKNNEAGNELVKFFGGQVFSLPIEDALKRKFLVPYYYHPIFVYASEEELGKFSKLSANMASCWVNNVCIDKDKFLRLAKARLRVIAMAEEKISNIDGLLKNIKEKDHFVVYCGDGRLFDTGDEEIRHIEFVKSHLDDLGIKTSQFTASEDMNRRMELVDMFNKKEIASLVAIRCLDEGINIPSIKSALILASNDDYREFVQRRGRILRKYEGKENAIIYDVIVLPTTDYPRFAVIELRRYYEYAKLAINNEELIDDLQEMLLEYGLSIEDVELYTELETEVALDD